MRSGEGADRQTVPTTPVRRAATLLAATSVLALPVSSASAVLGLPLPNLGQVVLDLGNTVESILPTGGVVTGVTGTVGGVVSGVQDSVTGSVDQVLAEVLGGSGGSALPTDTLDQLLAALGLGSSGGGTSGGGVNGSTGGVVGPGGVTIPNGVVDAAAPEPKFVVLSTLRQVHKTGSLRIQVTNDEAGIVAVGGAIRPGAAVKKATTKKKAKAKKSAAAKHDRRLIKFPSAVLAYRKAGPLTMTVKLGKAARKTLGASKDGRISFAVIAADVFRNQSSSYEKVKLKR